MQSGGESFVCTQMFNLADSDGSGSIDVLELSMFFRDGPSCRDGFPIIAIALAIHRLILTRCDSI